MKPKVVTSGCWSRQVNKHVLDITEANANKQN